jgi:hypothetical protein
MRDVDCNVRSVLVVRAEAAIRTPDDLAGKTLVLGSRQGTEGCRQPGGFQELLKALDEPPACCSSVCESCTGDGN